MRTFREFMEDVLYAPGRGFYQQRKPTEDFYTAPELHAAFAGILARQAVRGLGELESSGIPGPYQVVEMGCGEGFLARDFLAEYSRMDPSRAKETTYVLVDRSEPALKTARERVSWFERVKTFSSLDELEPGPGFFFSNELVDAFPVHWLEKSGESVAEVYIGENNRRVLGAVSSPELKVAAARLAAEPEGASRTVNLEARSWLKRVSGKLTHGFLVTVDYGKCLGPAAGAPRRYRRHRTDGDVAGWPGRSDLTADVDFGMLMEEGEKLGLKTVSYGTLGRFLLDHGIAEYFESAADFPSRMRLKTLIHPEGMGEAYKVLVQIKETPA